MNKAGVVLVSAAVQAFAAAIIAVFTVALWRSTSRLAEFTRDYVVEMRRNNDLTEQMARLDSVALARQVGAEAPSLVAVLGGRSVTDRVVSNVFVDNVGASTTYAVEVETTWGSVGHGLPIPPGEQAQIGVALETPDWERQSDPDPVVLEFRFKDPQGSDWTQSPGAAPVRASS